MEEVVEVENKKIEEKSIIRKFYMLFWIFIIGSVAGYVIEMIVGLVQNGHFVVRQGLIYGPFIQVYGFGLVMYYILVQKSESNLQIFLKCAILGGVVEYVFSFLQETIFGTISWDYSNLWFDINGRTSLIHCLYWGVGGILFSKYIRPKLDKIDNLYNKKYFKIVTLFLAIFIFVDVVISSMACERQEERRENILPKNKIDVFLDTYYTDEMLNKIYSNAKET